MTGGASYNKGSVPAATCQVTDAEDGNSSFPATLGAISGPYASDGIGSQTASCSYTDGWRAHRRGLGDLQHRRPVRPDDRLHDHAGESGRRERLVQERRQPRLDRDGARVAELPGRRRVASIRTSRATRQETTYSCAATSAGGSAGPESVTIKRDATAPTVSVVGGPGDGASYEFGSVPAAPTCTATDDLSGLSGACSVTATATASARIRSRPRPRQGGQRHRDPHLYDVLAWTLKGFYSPVDMGDAW